MGVEKSNVGREVRTVLVGCGAVASAYYAPALDLLQKSGESCVVGLVDPNTERLGRLGRRFPQAFRYETISGLSRAQADLAIVASPPRFHAEQTIALLKAGLSVLCEKPMATNVADGHAMVDAAERAPGIFAVGLVRRFFPAAQAIRDILSGGMIGEIRSFRFAECNNFDWPVASVDYFRAGHSGGGVLLDIGVHALDLLSWWWGKPDEISYEDDAMGGVEANCRLRLNFKHGFGGEIRLSRDWSMANEYFIRGTRGWLRWEVNEADNLQIGPNDSSYELHANLYKKASNPAVFRRPVDNFHRSFINQLRNVIDSVRTGRQPTISGKDGMGSIALIEQCYSHRRLMAMPWLH